MKDKTHAMNMGLSSEDAERGYGDAGTPVSSRERKLRQMKWANLEDNPGLKQYEGMNEADEDKHQGGGFLPRNNYEDRN